MKVTRTYNANFAEHTVTADGDTVATAHGAGGRWSVKMGDNLLGIAPTEAIATATLDKLAAAFARNLRNAGLDVEVV